MNRCLRTHPWVSEEKADALIFPNTVGELEKLVSFFLREEISFLPVGNCTNLIVRDGGYRGVLISMETLRRLEIRDENLPRKSASERRICRQCLCLRPGRGFTFRHC